MADMVFEMIQDADIDTRAEYYKHIVLSGMCVCVCVCACVCGWKCFNVSISFSVPLIQI